MRNEQELLLSCASACDFWFDSPCSRPWARTHSWIKEESFVSVLLLATNFHDASVVTHTGLPKKPIPIVARLQKSVSALRSIKSTIRRRAHSMDPASRWRANPGIKRSGRFLLSIFNTGLETFDSCNIRLTKNGSVVRKPRQSPQMRRTRHPYLPCLTRWIAHKW